MIDDYLDDKEIVQWYDRIVAKTYLHRNKTEYHECCHVTTTKGNKRLRDSHSDHKSIASLFRNTNDNTKKREQVTAFWNTYCKEHRALPSTNIKHLYHDDHAVADQETKALDLLIRVEKLEEDARLGKRGDVEDRLDKMVEKLGENDFVLNANCTAKTIPVPSDKLPFQPHNQALITTEIAIPESQEYASIGDRRFTGFVRSSSQES